MNNVIAIEDHRRELAHGVADSIEATLFCNAAHCAPVSAAVDRDRELGSGSA